MRKIIYLLLMLICSVAYADDTSPKFWIVTTPNTTDFSFNMTAKGDFTVDWGDGNIEPISRTDTTEATYTHTYDIAGEYTIGFDGVATGYNSHWSTSVFNFKNNKNLAAIYGSLGALFPSFETGAQPSYYLTFYGCSNLASEIPPELFRGNYGTMRGYAMFRQIFGGCSKLSGQIPPNLFSDMEGCIEHTGFASLFQGCKSLTGEIPEDLFAGFTGFCSSGSFQFNATFNGCSGLTGEIPEKLFSRIVADASKNPYAFRSTFAGCKNLTGFIPPGLFSGISTENGVANQFMSGTFTGSGIATQCPAGYHQYMTGFEEYLGGYVSCVPCPDEFPNSVIGATDVRMCYRGDLHKLHVVDNTVGLLTYKISEPALHVKIDGNVYYGAMTPVETNVMRDSEHKVKIRYNQDVYYLYDQTSILPVQ